jgi:osomolarity two-component system sensor histidine kinase NIK1
MRVFTVVAGRHIAPTCAKPMSDPLTFYNAVETDNSSLGSRPLVVPMGPLAAAAFKSGMTQKITAPVLGVIMVQLKDVTNAMVRVRIRCVSVG